MNRAQVTWADGTEGLPFAAPAGARLQLRVDGVGEEADAEVLLAHSSDEQNLSTFFVRTWETIGSI